MATTPPNNGASPPNSAGQPPQQGLSPEQQQQMQLVVKQCMQMVLDDQSADMIIAKCQQGNAPDVIASIVGPLLAKVHESAKGAGVNVDMVTMMVAGVQVIGTLAEMLWHADVIKSEQEVPAFIGQAAKLAVDKHNAMVPQGAGADPNQQPQQTPPAGGGMLAQGV